MKRIGLLLVVAVLSLMVTVQVFADDDEKQDAELWEEKDFYPSNDQAAVSYLVFTDLLSQAIEGTEYEENVVQQIAEEKGFWKGKGKAAIKHKEALELLEHVFHKQSWEAETTKNESKPVKWNEAKGYLNSVADYVLTDDSYEEESFNGTALINEPGVELEGVTIDGDLIITEGAEGETVSLKSTKVKGKVYIQDKVQNELVLDESEVNQVVVYSMGSEASDWSLVWNDEFVTKTIDSSKWSYDTGNWLVDEDGNGVSPGWGNNEQQYYTDSSKNSFIDDGNLVIKAIKEKSPVTDEYGSYDYTSAKLKTKGLFSKKYGKFEARMKLPEGQGYWPAFWMMPEDSVYGTWPASGEIDIMEAAGDDTSTIGGTIHYGQEYPLNTYRGKEYHFPEGEDYTGYHTYSVEWEPGEIRWYVDGELYQTLNNWFSKGPDQAANYTFPAPFDQPFYMILNLAVGGWYGGNADETTPFPGKMKVDYVRAYELTGRDYKEPVEPSTNLEPLPEEAKQPAEDGNLIYDTSYEKGFAIVDENTDTMDETYWNFLTLPDFGGQGSISTEVIDGTTFAKTEITQPGNALWALQLIQKLSIGEGRSYKVTFDAKSDANRTIMTKVSGGAERGYANYSGEQTIELTDTVQTYEYTFKHNQDNDLAARLEFNMGSVSTNPVWIGNVRIEEITGQEQESNQKEPLADGNHIYNGTFDQGDFSRMVYWDFATQNGADAVASVDPDDRFLHIDVSDGGTNPEDIQLKQTGLQFLKGNTYELTFRAKAEQSGETAVIDFISSDGATSYSGQKSVSLDADWNTYTVPFEMTTETTDLEGQLLIHLGGAVSDISIDDVRLIQTSSYIDYDNVDMNPLSNGDFSAGMDGWSSYIHNEGAVASVDVQQEVLKVDITNGGKYAWSVLAEHPALSLTKGVTYQLTFDAKSTVSRDMEVTVENAGYHRFFEKVISLTQDYQTFTYQWDMPADDEVSLKFLMGLVSDAHTIEIDNVQLEVVVPE
ncbi:carbohydrate binding domain-containing protein [Halobacillus yeomjeoni]|uniref:carbohydrate binding domain-containing protein n=1 Tax=Halobacillus yeomjeoni TaxID=311194 RepID=UPI001CD63F88|nr:carbohydrate binding domain-containing protein [Halobacillus yeomjeoni]MCA0984272.1 carbohydrate binding domain-containing protein [Halobacillus yeomjeoni]